MMFKGGVDEQGGCGLTSAACDEAKIDLEMNAAIGLLSDYNLTRRGRRSLARFIEGNVAEVQPALSDNVLYQLAFGAESAVLVSLINALPDMNGSKHIAIPTLVLRLCDSNLSVREAAALTLGRLGEDASGSFLIFEFFNHIAGQRELSSKFNSKLPDSNAILKELKTVADGFKRSKEAINRENDIKYFSYEPFWGSRDPDMFKIATSMLTGKQDKVVEELEDLFINDRGRGYEPMFAAVLGYLAGVIKNIKLSSSQAKVDDVSVALLDCCARMGPGAGLEYLLSAIPPFADLRIELGRNEAIIKLSQQGHCQDMALERIIKKISAVDSETYTPAVQSLVRCGARLSPRQQSTVVDAFFREIGIRLGSSRNDLEPICFLFSELNKFSGNDEYIGSVIAEKYQAFPSLSRFRSINKG